MHLFIDRPRVHWDHFKHRWRELSNHWEISQREESKLKINTKGFEEVHHFFGFVSSISLPMGKQEALGNVCGQEVCKGSGADYCQCQTPANL